MRNRLMYNRRGTAVAHDFDLAGQEAAPVSSFKRFQIHLSNFARAWTHELSSLLVQAQMKQRPGWETQVDPLISIAVGERCWD